ncbi:MAG: hypothetical protein ACP5P4_16045 [Steroidobacteraceae bacterium]
MSPTLRIPILVEETIGRDRNDELIRLGVPIPRGVLRSGTPVYLADHQEHSLPADPRPLTFWSDGSIKWLMVHAPVSLRPGERAKFHVSTAGAPQDGAEHSIPELRVEKNSGYIIDTGAATFRVGLNGPLIESAAVQGVDLLDDAGARLSLTGCSGHPYRPVTTQLFLEEEGPFRVAVVLEGHFAPVREAAGTSVRIEFKVRLVFTAGHSVVRVEVQLHNPSAARHPGGLWDLDDRGTAAFEDVTLSLKPIGQVGDIRWSAHGARDVHVEAPKELTFYQDSSGGENWDSDNHVDGRGQPTVTFRGYRVTYGDPGKMRLIAEGDRPTPALSAVTDRGFVAATVLDFWQNFPKALRWSEEILDVALFPWECRAPFALQGGERKRQTILLEFGPAGGESTLEQWQHPLQVSLDPEWVEQSGALEGFIPASRDRNAAYLQYIQSVIEGPHAFMAKRELIDEYGWRNFGDLYADHEAVESKGWRPLVSHYNNQYDFIYGALIHHLRTGDQRWRALAEDGARHLMDIDIYHTDEDKPAFNHGMFWHTDHYKPAATCTHRTYSTQNGRGLSYGGGPSNEHNYTSGLLLYYCLSGDPEAADAVRELAGWVIAMDGGAGEGAEAEPTGLASKTVDPSYHKPGRGAGNSINALLDAFQLSQERSFLTKAEELIARCIHPKDDIDALGLSEPEFRWSYLVFLQILGKYLHLKLELGETDYAFHYGRESLLHYARWMLEHEVPYRDVLHKVELPTESWPAQDVRKCHVLHLAGEFSPEPQRSAFHDKADFFFARSLEDLLKFQTAYVTRPLVIQCVYGHLQAFYQVHRFEGLELKCPVEDFGTPQSFAPPQRELPERVRDIGTRLVRTGTERLDVFRRLSTPSRL